MGLVVDALTRPDELVALLKYKFGAASRVPARTGMRASLKRCYELLDLTSRSFSAVIQQLDEELRPAIAVFYLVLRGLDTVEDDMTLALDRKVALLAGFHEVIRTRGWVFTESGPDEKDRQLLVEFDVVVEEFLQLRPAYQESIADITRRMAAGMAEFLHRKGVETSAEWDQYCHYVAGLVGIGLSRIFAQSGLEADDVGTREDLANSMGLFLQKTNIIRDYLEDLEDGRIFWPKQVWQRYGRSLSDFRKPAQKTAALACLNHLVTDALGHVPDVFAYMAKLRNQSVFNFCAIPQVMAIATLARCFNNYAVFTGVVKIRRGEAAKLIVSARSMDALAAIFDVHLAEISAAFPRMQTPYFETADTIRRIRKACSLPDDRNLTDVGVVARRRGPAALARRMLRWSLVSATLVGGAAFVCMRLLPAAKLQPAIYELIAAWRSHWSVLPRSSA